MVVQITEKLLLEHLGRCLLVLKKQADLEEKSMERWLHENGWPKEKELEFKEIAKRVLEVLMQDLSKDICEALKKAREADSVVESEALKAVNPEALKANVEIKIDAATNQFDIDAAIEDVAQRIIKSIQALGQ
jgi:hypothetical protein